MFPPSRPNPMRAARLKTQTAVGDGDPSQPAGGPSSVACPSCGAKLTLALDQSAAPAPDLAGGAPDMGAGGGGF